MGSDQDSTIGKGLIRTFDLLEHLISDVYVAFERLEAERNSQYLRRAVVRTVFSFIEGVVHILKRELRRELRREQDKSILSRREQEVLWETKQRDGESFRIYAATEENLKRTFSMSSKVWELGDYSFDAGGEEYEHFLKAKEARDRLVHPRTYYDIEITDDEMSHIAIAFEWIRSEFVSLWKARVEALAENLPEDVSEQILSEVEANKA